MPLTIHYSLPFFWVYNYSLTTIHYVYTAQSVKYDNKPKIK
jgi:hypothetical protein